MEKNTKSSWQEVVFKTKEWHKTLIQFELTDELSQPLTAYNPILCEKEWDAIQAIKKWRNESGLHFSLQDFDDNERISFEKLTEKSKNVYFKKNDAKPYKKVFYVPFAVWNDDVDAAPDFIPLKDKTIIRQYASSLYNSLKIRALNSMNTFFNGVKVGTEYGFETGSLWLKSNIDKLLQDGIDLSEMELTDIDENLIHSLSGVTKEFQEEWLQSALIPIVIAANEYEDISDFDFNYDGQLDVEMKSLKTMRADFEQPMSLNKALKRLEALKFSLWAKSVVYDNFVEGGVKRESVIQFHINNGDVVYVSVAVMDIDKNDEELIALTYGRRINDHYEIQETLLPWVMCADPRMTWSVMYTEDDFEEDNLPNNYKITYENTTIH